MLGCLSMNRSIFIISRNLIARIIKMSLIHTFDPDRISYLSRYETEVTDEKLSRYHNRIIQLDNKIDTEALQEYLNSVRASKVGNQRIFT